MPAHGDSNFGAEVGRKVDTGKKWIDGSVIFRKLLSIGALPNSTTKNVAHGEAAINLTKYARVSDFTARNGTQYISPPAITITNTNVAVTTTSDLSAYTGWVEIEFCE